MAIKAIPTMHHGVKMRSRLEARWASFFRMMGIPWSYEPVDMDGWIPDFAIWPQGRPAPKGSRVAGNDPIYVEVKPVWGPSEPAAREALDDFKRNGVDGILVGIEPTEILGWRVENRIWEAGLISMWDDGRPWKAMAGDSSAPCPLRIHVATWEMSIAGAIDHSRRDADTARWWFEHLRDGEHESEWESSAFKRMEAAAQVAEAVASDREAAHNYIQQYGGETDCCGWVDPHWIGGPMEGEPEVSEVIADMWKAAGNASQWRGR